MLLLFLRENSYGMQTVRDVGHMLGHSDARTKGISLSRVSEHYEMACFHMPRFAEGANRDLNLDDAPPRFFEAMDVTFRLLDDDILMRETGLTRPQASTRLTKLKRKFVKMPSGRIKWGRPKIEDQELALVKCLSSFMLIRPAYTGNGFFAEFSSLLTKHGFMDAGQEYDLERKKPLIILFAITAMHGVRYIMPDGNLVEAEAGWSTEGKEVRLGVSSTMKVPGLAATIGFPILETDLQAAQWCDEYSPDRRHARWKVPIELTPLGKIRTIA